MVGWTAGANQSHCITPLSAVWRRGNRTKVSWLEVRAGSNHSQVALMDTDLTEVN